MHAVLMLGVLATSMPSAASNWGARRGYREGMREIACERREMRREIGRELRYGRWERERDRGGELVAGIVLGALIASAVRGTPPAPPSPAMCWVWADPRQDSGWWDRCGGYWGTEALRPGAPAVRAPDNGAMVPPHSAPPAAGPGAACPPQRLATRIMRRAVWVAGVVWLVALALGLLRMAGDTEEELDAAASLAQAMAELGRLGASQAAAPDEGAAVLDALVHLQRARPFRHLRLQVFDDQGVLLLPALPPAPSASPAPGEPPQTVRWPLPRPDGRVWTVVLTTHPDAERREALASLAESLLLLAAAAGGLLVVMQWNLRRALAPLQRLLAAIAGIEQADTALVRTLPAMPVAELEAVAGALRHLGSALDEADAARRRLAQQVLSLQEDERARLARELHDEFGQRLTALRVEATWLARGLQPGAAPVGAGVPAAPAPAIGPVQAAASAHAMADRCGDILQDIRGLLARLQPFGPADPAGAQHDGGHEPLGRLAGLLDALVDAWSGRGPVIDARWTWRPAPGAAGAAVPWQALPDTPENTLPRPLALALYRITQEALTNAARHAGARRIALSITLCAAAPPGQPPSVHWCVDDDGCGLGDPAAAARRGNGLAGLRERVWALGGEFAAGPSPAWADAPGAGPGTRLQAWINTPAAALPPAAAAPRPPPR
jgi:two-component system sensor histidine kinase UhpB